MNKTLVLIILFIIISVFAYCDLASDLEKCVGYYVHSSYNLNGNLTGSMYGKELTLGQFRIRITEYSYLYAYYPTVVLLYHPDKKLIKLVVNDEILDAILIQY